MKTKADAEADLNKQWEVFPTEFKNQLLSPTDVRPNMALFDDANDKKVYETFWVYRKKIAELYQIMKNMNKAKNPDRIPEAWVQRIREG